MLVIILLYMYIPSRRVKETSVDGSSTTPVPIQTILNFVHDIMQYTHVERLLCLYKLEH